MENIQLKYIEIEGLLKQIRGMISNELGVNPYEDLEKMIKIISQKNYNHVPIIRDKLKNLSMMLYNRNLDCSKLVFEKLDEVYSLVTESPKI